MGWIEVAREQRGAAAWLTAPSRMAPRAAASRSYYAVYALIAGLAPEDFAFPKGWQNPSHDQIPEIIRRLKRADRRRIAELSAILLSERIEADYRPSAAFGANRAREAFRICEELFVLLEGTNANGKA